MPPSISGAKSVNSSLLLSPFTSFTTESALSIGFNRSLRVRNSSCSNNFVRSPSTTPDQARESILYSIGASCTNCVNSRLRITSLILSRSDWPTFPPTLSTLEINSLSDPYSMIHLAAVFSPTPGIDGRLSLGSPRRAAKSGY